MRILVFLLVVGDVLGQNDYADQNNIRKEQIASEKSEMEAIAVTYNPNSYSTRSALNVEINGAVDSAKSNIYNHDGRGRIRKIFRIKNPFQHSVVEEGEQEAGKQSLKLDTEDSATGASNQYAAMQYSLPPEEFLQKFRAENQYYQQQQQQVSTPAPTFGYTATPQPQYYSTTSATNFINVNQQKASSNPLESSNPSQIFNPNYNNYQYNNGYAYGIDAIQSTPSSVTLYLSTKIPTNQYVGTPSTTYLSSSSPIYQSSPSNLQSYISSTLSNIQTGLLNNNNNNRHSTAVENSSFNYGAANRANDQNMYVNYYSNSASGVQHPLNMRQQYQSEFPSSTQTPIISSTISNTNRDTWQNSLHHNSQSVPISRQEFSKPSQVNFVENRQQENNNFNNQDIGTHRVGSMQSANNLFLSFVRPDYQTFNTVRNDQDMESQQTTQTDVYSYGDYGWKQDGRKAIVKYGVSSPPHYLKQESLNYPAGSNYISSPNGYLDTSRTHDYNPKSKLNSEKVEDQEFAKAAAKALQNMKKQQPMFLSSYSSQIQHLPDNSIDPNSIPYSNHNDNKEINFVTGNPNTHISSSQYDVITASPYYFTNTKESNLGKHDVLSVTPDATQVKFNVGANLNVGYNSTNHQNEVNEQNLKQNFKTYQAPNYNDKNMLFNLNAETKLEEKPPAFSSYHVVQSFDSQKQYESPQNANSLNPNPQSNLFVSPANYIGQSTLNNVQRQNNIQQISTRQQIQENNDGMNNLKINDIPHWLIRGLNSGNLRMNNKYENVMSTVAPLILNQNVNAHQLDAVASILNKLIKEKQDESSKSEYNSQAGSLLPTINGLKIVNPYNLDLNLVAEILKARPSFSDVSPSFHNQISHQLPFRWDTSQLQQLMLRNDNTGNMVGSQNGMGTVMPFMESNNNGGIPYQGVKYSRSQEEEESLVPITDASLIHPIGAVIEQDDLLRENREENDSDMAGSNNEDFPSENDDEKSQLYSGHRMVSRNRQPNSLIPESHYHHHRKIPKMIAREPYPLLRPPPPHSSNSRYRKNHEHANRRQRHNKIKVSRIVKREPVFEDEDYEKDDQPTVPILLRPPPITAEDKADTFQPDDN